MATTVGAADKQCYINALRALFCIPGATYVEGVAVCTSGVPHDHAWLETAAGVVDPTPAYAASTGRPYTYFSGARWTAAQIEALLMASPDGIETPALGWGSRELPHMSGWIDAKLASFRHMSALAVRRGGQPLVEADGEAVTLEALIGSYWANWLQRSAA